MPEDKVEDNTQYKCTLPLDEIIRPEILIEGQQPPTYTPTYNQNTNDNVVCTQPITKEIEKSICKYHYNNHKVQ